MKRALVLLFVVAGIGCGKKASTEPTPVQTPTKIIRLVGQNMSPSVTFGSSSVSTIQVWNDGNTNLSFTGIQATGGLANVSKVNITQGGVAPNQHVDVLLTFTPTAVQNYPATLSFTSDATSGANTIAFNGSVNLDGIPVFTKSGTGNQVFDLPTYITRLHIVGTFGGSCQNFIVHVAGRSIVNEILGTCSVNTTGARYDGTHQLSSPGGTVEVLNASGVNWTIEELR